MVGRFGDRVSLWEILFGKPTIDRLQTQLTECKTDKMILTQNYQKLAQEKLQIVLNCNTDKLLLHQKIRELENSLEQAEEKFDFPLIPDYKETPYDVSNISDFYDVEFIRADAKYNLFSKEDWVSILNEVYPLVKEALVRWKRDIADCDDWSLVSAALVSVAFKKSGYLMQGAYAIAHTVDNEPSRHAYNLFVDKESKIWLYEPQTNQLKGLMKDAEGIYKTGYVLFLS